ncbi:hypothetical protein PR048_018451 [Dryococelus australis]|uniref:Uncharacterized protein n=1 Tax=Dryococelus australis TaxID=614101 RepID=A0ABQ9HD20_9NEOP|nr:hypothetical protein PR048_018451 [Dryococelus australis]
MEQRRIARARKREILLPGFEPNSPWWEASALAAFPKSKEPPACILIYSGNWDTQISQKQTLKYLPHRLAVAIQWETRRFARRRLKSSLSGTIFDENEVFYPYLLAVRTSIMATLASMKAVMPAPGNLLAPDSPANEGPSAVQCAVASQTQGSFPEPRTASQRWVRPQQRNTRAISPLCTCILCDYGYRLFTVNLFDIDILPSVRSDSIGTTQALIFPSLSSHCSLPPPEEISARLRVSGVAVSISCGVVLTNSRSKARNQTMQSQCREGIRNVIRLHPKCHATKRAAAATGRSKQTNYKIWKEEKLSDVSGEGKETGLKRADFDIGVIRHTVHVEQAGGRDSDVTRVGTGRQLESSSLSAQLEEGGGRLSQPQVSSLEVQFSVFNCARSILRVEHVGVRATCWGEDLILPVVTSPLRPAHRDLIARVRVVCSWQHVTGDPLLPTRSLHLTREGQCRV